MDRFGLDVADLDVGDNDVDVIDDNLDVVDYVDCNNQGRSPIRCLSCFQLRPRHWLLCSSGD